MLQNIAPIEKQIKFFEQSGITVPDELLPPFERECSYSRMFPYSNGFNKEEHYTKLFTPTIKQAREDRDRYYQSYYSNRNSYLLKNQIDAMRVALGYTGIQKKVLDTKLKRERVGSILEYWHRGDSVLCLTDDDINALSGFF